MDYWVLIQSLFLLTSYIFHVPSCIAWSPTVLTIFVGIITGLSEANNEVRERKALIKKFNKVNKDKDMGETIDEIVKKMK